MARFDGATTANTMGRQDVSTQSRFVLIQSPLNLVGMPYYSEPLLSNFAPTDYAPVTSPFFNPPEPVPPNVLTAMKVIDFVGYATLPRDLRGKRYVVNARPGAGKLATGRGFVNGRRESAPRFRSDKDRKRDLSVEPEEEVSEVTERCFSR